MKEQKPLAHKSGVILTVRKKVGHARQGEAVALAMNLPYQIVDCANPDAADVAAASSFLIAAGRQSIRVARRAARASEVVSCVLQPVLWRPGDFDVIWSPEHDRSSMAWREPPSATRVHTLTAPSRPGRASGADWAPPIDAPGPYIAVLVGGPTRIHRMRKDEIEELSGRLRAFAEAYSVSLLIATSRRTPAGAATRLTDALHDVPHVLVDAQRPRPDDPPDPVDAFLSLADAAVVTNDSVAMLSEAAAVGVPILGWRLPSGHSKFDRLYDGLIAHGAMRWFDGTFERWTYPPLDAAHEVATAILHRMGLLPAK